MTLTDLQKFCSTDETRPQICRPFSQGTWTYATDGRVIVRVPRMAEVPEYDDSPKAEPLFVTNPITEQWFKVPDDLPKGEKCEHCGGDGESLKATPVKVGNQLASHILLKLVSTLPNVEICNSAKGPLRGLGIKFDGGDGRLMPMKE